MAQLPEYTKKAEPELSEGNPNVCPKCGFTFVCLQFFFDEEGNPTGMAPVETHEVHAGIPFYCPRCGVDMKTFAKEQNAGLDKLIAWKKWAGEPESALQNKQLSNGG